jgi:acetyltransferase
MRALLETARTRGLRTMDGIVLRANRKMLRLARQLGFELRHDPDDRSVVRVQRRLDSSANSALPLAEPSA